MTHSTTRHSPRMPLAPLTVVLIGGLAMYHKINTATVMAHATTMGLDADAAARAVVDLIDRGVASVSRTGNTGHLIATPALADLPRAERVHAILAHVSITNGTSATGAVMADA